MTESYVLPATHKLFHKLIGAKSFANIDLSSAYYQIELDDKAHNNAPIKMLMDFAE